MMATILALPQFYGMLLVHMYSSVVHVHINAGGWVSKKELKLGLVQVIITLRSNKSTDASLGQLG